MILGLPGRGKCRAARPGPYHASTHCFAGLRRGGLDAIALADAPNRQRFTDGAPLRLSYAEADRMISAIAGRLRRMGLPTDAIVGIQMPNIVEHVLTILGVLRAGLIAAPLPLLWRRADAVTALARVGAKALIACRRVGGFEHCQLALHVAAEVFSIRYVCGFGGNLPDGVVAFDDLFTTAKLDPVPPLDRDAQCRSPSRGDDFRGRRGRSGAGGAAPSRTFGRRACASARKPAASKTPACFRHSRRPPLPASASRWCHGF